jgi:hypothetical protein
VVHLPSRTSLLRRLLVATGKLYRLDRHSLNAIVPDERTFAATQQLGKY